MFTSGHRCQVKPQGGGETGMLALRYSHGKIDKATEFKRHTYVLPVETRGNLALGKIYLYNTGLELGFSVSKLPRRPFQEGNGSKSSFPFISTDHCVSRSPPFWSGTADLPFITLPQG